MNFIKSDITGQTSGLIIHGCNSRGIMGSGVALAIKNKWPIAYHKYKELPRGESSLGMLQIVKINDNLYVGNGITQLNYGNDGKVYADIKAIETVLKIAFNFAQSNHLILKSPKIGSLRGGLDWETQVLPLFIELNKIYDNVDVQIFDL